MAIELQCFQEACHVDKGFEWCSSLLTGVTSEGTQVVISREFLHVGTERMYVCVCVRVC